MDDTFVYKAQQLTFDGNGAWQTYQSRSSLNVSPIVQAILGIAPSLLFIIAAVFRILALKPRPNVARPGWLLAAKLVTCAALLCLQTSLVALLFLTAASSRAAVATAAVRLIGSCTLLALSYLEHRRTINPSIIIGAFLWTTVILDLARATTLLPLRQSGLGDGLAAPVFAAVQAVQLMLLILEEIPKQSLLPKRDGGWPAESTSGPFSRCVFWWLRDVFIKGYKGTLRAENVGTIDDQFSSRKILDGLTRSFGDANAPQNHHLLRAIWSAFKLRLLWPTIPRLFKTAFSFAQPFLIKRLISFLSHSASQSSSQEGWTLILTTGPVYLGIAISSALYAHVVNRLLTTLRGVLVAAMLDKSLKFKDSDDDAAVTLMTADIEGIFPGVKDVYELVANTVELVLAIFLSTYVSDGIGPARMDWAEATQKRVSTTSLFLTQIKSLKMMGLTAYVSRKLRGLRIQEASESKKFRTYIVWILGVANISHHLTPAVVILAAVFWTRSGGEGFTVAQAFTSLSILSLISTPIAELTAAYPTIAASLACLERVEAYILSEEQHDKRVVSKQLAAIHSNDDESLGQPGRAVDAPVVALRHVNLILPGKSEPILQDITIDIKKSAVTMILGPVGCGKSLLLHSILGHIPITSGCVFVSRGGSSMAYFDQTPWLRNLSIRDNIIAGDEYNPTWYDTVVRACALEQDIARLPYGHHTNVGSGGVNLSGGQKQRMVVHHLHYADHILVLGKSGKVEQYGSYSDLRARDGYIKSLDLRVSSQAQSREGGAPLGPREEGGKWEPNKEGDDPQPEVTADWTLYKFYLSSVEAWYLIVFILLGVSCNWVGKLPQVWLRLWTEHGTTTDTALYASIYVALGFVAIILSAAVFWWYGLFVIPKSGVYIHQLLLDSYLRAPLWFLTETDTGSMLDRFSQDMSLVDQQMPMAFFETVLNTADTVAAAAIIASGAPYLGGVMGVSLVVVYYLQQFYLKTAKTLRHLDLQTKSPLYTFLTEVKSGILTIRSLGWQDAYVEEGLRLLDASQKPYYLMLCIQECLSLVLGIFVAVISVILVSLSISYPDISGGGAIGLAMIGLMSFNGSLYGIVMAWTKMETSLGAAARVRTFVRDTPDENLPGESSLPAKSWPTTDDVEVAGIHASYKDGGEQILRDISLNARGGQKIGICGTTGSGKSSLLLTLLRLLETSSGHIRIDGVDLSTVPRQILRTRLTVLPQDSIALPESVRMNLHLASLVQNDSDSDVADDSSYHDQALQNALERAGLWDLVRQAGGLDADFTSLGLAPGQRQLFALARTLLRKTKVILLDEATSSMDEQTSKLMQQVMADAFEGSTALTVAHRLQTIADSDYVMVIEDGRVVEAGDPRALMARADSRLRKLSDEDP
ncbi:hypothetical protein PCL_05374 [Purpureocillium lilacinum]|uniref:ABC multidrug transporter n=1 Tax=Purpureocillium lilacinum TaxID=33203 RepID=A0A2U3DV73_PURLI|nr:hypothetical protein PCL_05374 [Purpureocillium lilacinum]